MWLHDLRRAQLTIAAATSTILHTCRMWMHVAAMAADAVVASLDGAFSVLEPARVVTRCRENSVPPIHSQH